MLARPCCLLSLSFNVEVTVLKKSCHPPSFISGILSFFYFFLFSFSLLLTQRDGQFLSGAGLECNGICLPKSISCGRNVAIAVARWYDYIDSQTTPNFHNYKIENLYGIRQFGIKLKDCEYSYSYLSVSWKAERDKRFIERHHQGT